MGQFNRAAYQHPANIHLGSNKPKPQILTGSQRMQVRAAIQMLENSLKATSTSFADINIANAYRECRSLCSQRVSKK